MKLFSPISKSRRVAGIMLTECIVYLAVFAILTSIGMAAFYFCWNHSRAVIYATEDIAAALRAGERWRVDVRGATGKISVETTATGEMVRLPEPEKEIIYRFAAGELRREIPALNISQVLLPKIQASQMLADARGPVQAWRWELQLTERRKENHLPLRFTFEAAQTKP
jgi:uncharacterized protein YndB with AHSA1/START domain